MSMRKIPKAKGCLLEITRGCNVYQRILKDPLWADAHDTYELTGNVFKSAADRYYFEGYLDSPKDTVWISNDLSPHTQEPSVHTK